MGTSRAKTLRQESKFQLGERCFVECKNEDGTTKQYACTIQAIHFHKTFASKPGEPPAVNYMVELVKDETTPQSWPSRRFLVLESQLSKDRAGGESVVVDTLNGLYVGQEVVFAKRGDYPRDKWGCVRGKAFTRNLLFYWSTLKVHRLDKERNRVVLNVNDGRMFLPVDPQLLRPLGPREHKQITFYETGGVVVPFATASNNP